MKTMYRVGFGFALAALNAMAAGIGGALPWEKPMTMIAGSLTGNTGYAVTMIGIAVAGYSYISQEGNHTGIGRTGTQLGIGGGLILGAAPAIATLFGAGGAVI